MYCKFVVVMNIDLTKVKKRSHQEVEESGKVKSKRGGWAKPNMVPISRKIHASMKERIEKCVNSPKTLYNTETEFLRAALARLLEQENF